MNQDTVIFLLQHLGFVINLQKSKLDPNTKLEFWGVKINLVDMTMYLPKEKITDITRLCKKLFSQENTTLRELASLIGKLISTYQAVLPAPLRSRSLQIHQITKLRANLCYKDNKSECSLLRGTKVMVPQSEFEQSENYRNSKCGNYN